MELPGGAAHAIRSCLCMFRRGRTFSEKTRTSLKFIKKWSHFGLHFGLQLPQNAKKCIWVFWGAKWRVRDCFGVQNGGERLRLGCKMEGPGAVWGAKWRVRERSESTVAGTALAHWIRRARPSLSLAWWIPIRKKSSKTFSRMGTGGAPCPPPCHYRASLFSLFFISFSGPHFL